MSSVSDSDVLTVSGGDSPENLYTAVYAAVYDAVTDVQETQEGRQTVTDGQTIGSSVLTYFSGILGNSLIPRDYVVWVGEPYTYDYSSYGQRTAYEYCLAVGDLSCSGTYFSGTADVWHYRSSGTPSVTVEHGQTVSLNAPPYYSRSNLGDYSGIVTYDRAGYLVLILLVTGGLVWFIRKLMRLRY